MGRHAGGNVTPPTATTNVFRIAIYNAKPETTTVWLPVDTITFESPDAPDDIKQAIREIVKLMTVKVPD